LEPKLVEQTQRAELVLVERDARALRATSAHPFAPPRFVDAGCTCIGGASAFAPQCGHVKPIISRASMSVSAVTSSSLAPGGTSNAVVTLPGSDHLPQRQSFGLMCVTARRRARATLQPWFASGHPPKRGSSAAIRPLFRFPRR